MTPGFLNRKRLGGVLAVLVLSGATAGVLSVGAAADQAWAPVVVMPAGELPPLTRAPVRAASKSERPARAAKTMPIDADPAKPLAVPVVADPIETSSAPPAAAKGSPKPVESSPQPAPAPAAKALVTEGTAAQQYCANIADAAADARFAWQKKMLAEAQQEVEKRIVKLDAKIAEYQKWLARRDEFSKKAQASLVSIYSRMRPDAAASQLVKMDEETAAAVLLKLDPRVASIILNEIPAAQAARLTGTISGAARTTTDKKKS